MRRNRSSHASPDALGASAARGASTCTLCGVPRAACICDVMRTYPTRTRLWLVLHVYESNKSSNTGLLATRLLPNSRVFLRGGKDDGPTVAPSPGPFAAWLFPSASALSLEEWRASLPPGEAPTLIVPDGTWRQAARAHRRVEGLTDLPCVTLPAGAPGRYRLRKASTSARLATLEAIARAVALLEEDPALEDGLLHVFDTFVERMLVHRGKVAVGRRQDADERCAEAELVSPEERPPSEDDR